MNESRKGTKMAQQQAQTKNGAVDSQNLDLLMNVPLRVTAELGTCRMLVQDILKLGTGSVVELDRLAGGPVDLLVNSKLVARGEVVAIDDNFGVRVTELIQKPT
ncbi:MAG: flagellar motor switch protein FliN [Candidatus Eremiobacteraeota bacterium]|nr:flagellar motor switch protein FliN [Candidatus Eremiobacteraeota bacterium]